MDDHVVVSIKSRPDVPLSLAPSASAALVSHLYRLHQQKKNADLRVLSRRRRRLFVLKYLGLALVSRNFGNYLLRSERVRLLLSSPKNWLLQNEITLAESLFIRVAAAAPIDINHIPSSLHAAD
jgi:hypothetical protein